MPNILCQTPNIQNVKANTAYSSKIKDTLKCIHPRYLVSSIITNYTYIVFIFERKLLKKPSTPNIY